MEVLEARVVLSTADSITVNTAVPPPTVTSADSITVNTPAPPTTTTTTTTTWTLPPTGTTS